MFATNSWDYIVTVSDQKSSVLSKVKNDENIWLDCSFELRWGKTKLSIGNDMCGF